MQRNPTTWLPMLDLRVYTACTWLASAVCIWYTSPECIYFEAIDNYESTAGADASRGEA